MSEDQPAVVKKKEPPSSQRKMAKAINDTLGLTIDWTQLCECDLKALHTLVTDDRRLRRLAIRVLRKKLYGLGHQAKTGLKDTIRDIVSESGLGERALKFMSGDDEEEDDGLEDA